MSVTVTTSEELMQLRRPHLKLALRLFQQELEEAIARLRANEAAGQDEAALDELSNLITLRKVVKLRLEELLELEEGPNPTPAAVTLTVGPSKSVLDRYYQNELQPA